MFLILVDTNTKWVKLYVVTSSLTEATTEKMKVIFATLGLPQILFMENSSKFTLVQFAKLTKNNGIRHVTSLSYHLSTNGMAARTV